MMYRIVVAGRGELETQQTAIAQIMPMIEDAGIFRPQLYLKPGLFR